MGQKFESYRALLLEAGFAEASKNPFHFWKILYDKTAFIVNLKILPDGVGVVYGCTSTASLWTEKDWEYFYETGASDDDCKLRYYAQILSESDEATVGESIRALHERYREVEKDDLLKDVKERKKEFINRIHARLKPLGFRKKGNQWKKQLNDELILAFCADKPPFCDLFYFEVYILTKSPSYCMGCYNKRLEALGTDIFDFKIYSESHYRYDWQLQAEEFEPYFERILQEEILPLVNTDLSDLGKNPEIAKRCYCPQDRCASCWIAKEPFEETI